MSHQIDDATPGERGPFVDKDIPQRVAALEEAKDISRRDLREFRETLKEISEACREARDVANGVRESFDRWYEDMAERCRGYDQAVVAIAELKRMMEHTTKRADDQSGTAAQNGSAVAKLRIEFAEHLTEHRTRSKLGLALVPLVSAVAAAAISWMATMSAARYAADRAETRAEQVARETIRELSKGLK